jgi:hypothetical protein
MIKFFVFFFQSVQQNDGQYLKVGHDFLRSHSFQFKKPPTIRRYMIGNMDDVMT